MCGFAGKKSSIKFARISGLDPAGLYFDTDATNILNGLQSYPYKRLDKGDAEFVDVYHTTETPYV